MSVKIRDDFIDLVARMRAAQKIYFSKRASDALSESKRLEREVDAAIERLTNDQKDLFDA